MDSIHTIIHRVAKGIVWIPRLIMLGLIWFYRNAISPFTPPTCRFHPTCSSYAEQAFREYGFVKGLIMTVHRVGRCHPWGGSGYDPPRWFGEPPPEREHIHADQAAHPREKPKAEPTP